MCVGGGGGGQSGKRTAGGITMTRLLTTLWGLWNVPSAVTLDPKSPLNSNN